MRFAIAGALLLWAGATLLLAEVRWFARPRLVDRLRPYHPMAMESRRSPILSAASFREVIGPLSRSLGAQVSRIFGVSEELAVRLERIHSPLDVTAFRVKQVGWAIAGFGVAAVSVAVMSPPLPLAFLVLIGAPLLAFLVIEQQVASRSAAWQRRIFLELPVLSEQLAMLLSAGYSLGAALNRLADRGSGAAAADLRRVCRRMRQGLTEIDALREWAVVARVPALDRLIPVLALNREAGDLGRLISEQARSIRADSHRRLIETMERRSQQVWIPVTVATLIPGVIFLSIPFVEALRQFAGS